MRIIESLQRLGDGATTAPVQGWRLWKFGAASGVGIARESAACRAGA